MFDREGDVVGLAWNANVLSGEVLDVEGWSLGSGGSEEGCHYRGECQAIHGCGERYRDVVCFLCVWKENVVVGDNHSYVC